MDNLPADIPYQVLALSLKQEDAIEYFGKNLPIDLVYEYGKGHGEMYRALCTFYHETGVSPIDMSSFKAWLRTETLIPDALGGDEQLDEYFETVGKAEDSTPQSVSALMRLYVNKARRKEKIEELALASQEKEFSNDRIDEIITDIQNLSSSGADPLKGVYNGEMIAASADELWELPDFLPTPFKSLNVAMGYSEEGGFCKGAVHGILAQSGHGKSTFAKTLMNHWVSEDKTVLYLNYEEAKAHWERVLFTQITKQNVYLGKGLSNIERKHYTEIFKETMRDWNGRFIVKHDPETPFFEDMEAWVREVANKGKKFDVLVIDTIQSMYLKSARSAPRWQQFEQMMVSLEKLAKDLHCVIIITAQENSNRMKEAREVVKQSDAGGSLTIIQKCAVTIFITQAKMAINDDAMEDQVMQLQIPKNRITGTSSSEVNAPLVRYNDAIKSYEDFVIPNGDNYEQSINTDALANPY